MELETLSWIKHYQDLSYLISPRYANRYTINKLSSNTDFVSGLF